MPWTEIKLGGGRAVRGGKGSCNLNRVVREGLSEEVTFEQRLEGDEEGRHADTWGKSLSGKGNSQCRGLEVGGAWCR